MPRYMRSVVLISAGMMAVLLNSHAQVTANVLQRTFLIRIGQVTGTAFTLDIDDRQYLVTAKHVVATLSTEGTIEIRKRDEWLSLPVKVFRCDEPVDIAVLVPPEQVSVSVPLETNSKSFYYGQEAYFVGFPYDVSFGFFTVAEAANSGFPIPFMKKAAVSACNKREGVDVCYLDGHNNPGFSGSPAVFRDLNHSEPRFVVLGVVSGYESDFSPVYKLRPVKANEITAEDKANGLIVRKGGRLFRLEDSGEVVKGNTGIVITYDIHYAVDLARRHAVGPKVSAQFVGWPTAPHN